MTRTIRQPGPPATERVTAVQAGAIAIEASLPAGTRLLDALAQLVAQHHAESACLHLSGGALFPFAYVIPGLSPDGSQAAFYSDTFRPPGHSVLEAGAVTVGWRDGKPFFHCHAIWTEADGKPGCGHVLPDDTIIAAPIQIHGSLIVGARFQVGPDPETGFSLFTPRPTGTPPPASATPAVALRLAPNQDLIQTLESAAASAGFTRAIVQGGVASTIEARFDNAPPLAGFATELLVRRGTIDGTPHGASELDIAIVDYLGNIATGRLTRGDNPVLMTFEGLLQAA